MQWLEFFDEEGYTLLRWEESKKCGWCEGTGTTGSDHDKICPSCGGSGYHPHCEHASYVPPL